MMVQSAAEPAKSPEATRLTDQRLGLRRLGVLWLCPWGKQRHVTASIIAMTSSGR